MAKEKKKSWIIVTNKKTYLFLAAVLGCICFLIGDGIYVFGMGKREITSFFSDVFTCLMISIICIYFFVRFNTYSHIYNPDHPKPNYDEEES